MEVAPTLLTVQAEIVKVSTMAHRSVRIVADSQENISDEQLAKIMGNHGKVGWWAFLPEERKLDALDVVNLPKIEWDSDEKSPAKRLQAALFIWYSQLEKKPTNTFREFYERYMEKQINGVKEKLV